MIKDKIYECLIILTARKSSFRWVKNPTPVSINEAYENLVEEFGDVLNCIYAYFDDDAEKIWSFTVEADKIADEKRKRWIKRLKERNQF